MARANPGLIPNWPSMWANQASHEISCAEIDFVDLLKRLDLRLGARTEIRRSWSGEWKLVVRWRKSWARREDKVTSGPRIGMRSVLGILMSSLNRKAGA